MDEAPSRAERRAQRDESPQRRNRILLAAGGAVLVIAAIVVALVAFGGDSDDAKKQASPETQPKTSVNITVGEISTDSGGPPVTFGADQAQGLLERIRTFVDVAAVKPLRTAQPAGDLSGVFDAATLAKVMGADRAVMLQEGLPKVTGKLDVTADPVAFVALGDQEGQLVLVSASLHVTVNGTIAGTKVPLHVEQTGDFVFSPDAGGAWKVSSYSITVNRSGGGVDETTTTLAPTSTTKVKRR